MAKKKTKPVKRPENSVSEDDVVKLALLVLTAAVQLDADAISFEDFLTLLTSQLSELGIHVAPPAPTAEVMLT